MLNREALAIAQNTHFPKMAAAGTLLKIFSFKLTIGLIRWKTEDIINLTKWFLFLVLLRQRQLIMYKIHERTHLRIIPSELEVAPPCVQIGWMDGYIRLGTSLTCYSHMYVGMELNGI